MNSVFIDGRLTKDPMVKNWDKNGKTGSIILFSIANNEKVKIGTEWKERVQFINCKVLSPYLIKKVTGNMIKGTNVLISGKFEVSEYTNKEGIKVQGNAIICEDIQFIRSNKELQDSKPRDYYPTQAPSFESINNAFADVVKDMFAGSQAFSPAMEDEDDIPF